MNNTSNIFNITSLVCPEDHTGLKKDNTGFICAKGHRFESMEGVPILVPIRRSDADSDLQISTRDHYDDHPFDFLDGRDLDRIEDLQPKPFLEFSKSI